VTVTAVLLVVVGSGCHQPPAERTNAAPASAASAFVPPASPAVSDSARAVLDRYLALSIENDRPDAKEMEQVLSPGDTCYTPSDVIYSYWLASSRVLGLQVHGDSARAEVEALTVAEQVPNSKSAYGSTVTRRIRRDTLDYTLIREPSGGGWRICGDASNGYGFGGYGRPEYVTYEPRGVTRASLLALVDSVRRHLPK
jgi:hypothetical protein